VTDDIERSARVSHRSAAHRLAGARWRELWRRRKTVMTEEDAIEAISDVRGLLAHKDLLLPLGKE